MKLLRSLLGGGAATIADLLVLTLLVAAHVDPRVANVPALLVGGVVQFVANRRFAFRADGDPLAPQLAGFVVVEGVALALNGVLFDLVMRRFAAHPAQAETWAIPVRLATSHLVFLAWSFPLWHLVFRKPVVQRAA